MGKRGPRAGTEKRGAPTGIRFDPALKARLTEAARQSGRTFSEEVTTRLAASFSAVEFRDPQTKALLALIAYALEMNAVVIGKRWFEDPWVFRQCEASITDILSFLRPLGAPDVPDDLPVFNKLRESGLENLVPGAKLQLEELSPGSSNGKKIIWVIEAIADGRGDETIPIVDAITDGAHLDTTWDHLKILAEIVKARLIAVDADGQADVELRQRRRSRPGEKK